MPQTLQDVAKFQKFQLDNLVDFEKCCKTSSNLRKSVPIQPKTTENLPKIGNYLTGGPPHEDARREEGHGPELPGRLQGSRLTWQRCRVPGRRARMCATSPIWTFECGSLFRSFRGSFSAVSTPIFATKAPFFEIYSPTRNCRIFFLMYCRTRDINVYDCVWRSDLNTRIFLAYMTTAGLEPYKRIYVLNPKQRSSVYDIIAFKRI